MQHTTLFTLFTERRILDGMQCITEQCGPGLSLLLKLLFLMLWMIHVVGCLWWFTGMYCYQGPYPDANWIIKYDVDLINDPILHQYLVSCYFACTTLTTVGYGDITPRNDTEILLGMFCLLMGVLVYALIVNSVGQILDDASANRRIRSVCNTPDSPSNPSNPSNPNYRVNNGCVLW
jgi:hypothetical protein